MLKQIPDLVRGGVLDKVIPSFDYLVYLFMIISGFGMCNGYYQKLKTGTYSIDAFYSKRYKRTVPFFALLILLNCVIEFTPKTVCEGLMEITMLFGFLPNNTLSTIGVAWTLGAIFAFYIIFPFIVFLLYSPKKRNNYSTVNHRILYVLALLFQYIMLKSILISVLDHY